MLTNEAAATITDPDDRTATTRTWGICLMMLLATMLNYMDRQTLSQQATDISRALHLDNEQYGLLESGFGRAFAIGGVVAGLAVDRMGPRWLYPIVLLGWSMAGFATGWASTYRELWYGRVVLGFFEAGQWPCALVTAQRLLSRRDRALGNSLIQSGASLGAIATPMVVLAMSTGDPDDWRLPFRVIGAIGLLWVVAWLILVRPGDLALREELAPSSPSATPRLQGLFVRRLLILIVVVTVINLCFHFFRAWMPKMLREEYGFRNRTVQQFSVAYYLATDAGCLAVGFLVRWLANRGWSIHGARISAFAACCVLTALSTVAAMVPGSWMLMALLLVIGFGSLGQFPVYYAFTQELSARRMGNVTGILGFAFWMIYSLVGGPIGRWIDRTGAFSQVMFGAGLLPMIGLLAVGLFWGREPTPKSESDAS